MIGSWGICSLVCFVLVWIWSASQFELDIDCASSWIVCVSIIFHVFHWPRKAILFLVLLFFILKHCHPLQVGEFSDMDRVSSFSWVGVWILFTHSCADVWILFTLIAPAGSKKKHHLFVALGRCNWYIIWRRVPFSFKNAPRNQIFFYFCRERLLFFILKRWHLLQVVEFSGMGRVFSFSCVGVWILFTHIGTPGQKKAFSFRRSVIL